MSTELANHYDKILDGITGDLSAEANDFGFTQDEQATWLAEMETTGEMLNRMLADRERWRKQEAEREGKTLLPPTAKELKDLLDHIAQRNGYQGAQEVINLATFSQPIESILLDASDEPDVDESDLAA